MQIKCALIFVTLSFRRQSKAFRFEKLKWQMHTEHG